MNKLYIGMLVSAMAFLAFAGPVQASALDEEASATKISLVGIRGTCAGVGTGTSCIGVYLYGGHSCTGLWSGNRCVGVQT